MCMVVLSSLVRVRLKVSVVSQWLVVIQCWCQIRYFMLVVVVGVSIGQVFSEVSVVIGQLVSGLCRVSMVWCMVRFSVSGLLCVIIVISSVNQYQFSSSSISVSIVSGIDLWCCGFSIDIEQWFSVGWCCDQCSRVVSQLFMCVVDQWQLYSMIVYIRFRIMFSRVSIIISCLVIVVMVLQVLLSI